VNVFPLARRHVSMPLLWGCHDSSDYRIVHPLKRPRSIAASSIIRTTRSKVSLGGASQHDIAAAIGTRTSFRRIDRGDFAGRARVSSRNESTFDRMQSEQSTSNPTVFDRKTVIRIGRKNSPSSSANRITRRSVQFPNDDVGQPATFEHLFHAASKIAAPSSP